MKKQKSLAISFEFFPPKTNDGIANLREAALQLIHQQPDFFSVTFGAGGSTREGTIETTKLLQKITPIQIAPHLSCVGASRFEICDLLEIYKKLGIKRIVALRGDLPSGMGQAGEFRYASDLVTLIRNETGNYFDIEVAAYPEVHPQSQNSHTDLLSLKKKFEAGANSAITQYFFNPDAYFYFLDECSKNNITLPIIPGIMPITQFTKLVRFSNVCGAEIPRWLYKRLENYGDDVDSIKAYGTEVVYNLCQTLIDGGAPGLHFYTLNRAQASIELLALLGINKKEDKRTVEATI